MKRKGKTAAELLNELAKDDKYQSRMRAKELDNCLRRKVTQSELRHIVDELNSAGYSGENLGEIVQRHSPLPAAVCEKLLRAMSEDVTDRGLESICRALAASANQFDGRALVRIFESTSDESLKWAIVNTIALTAPHSIDDWQKRIAMDPYWGSVIHDLRPNPT